MEHIIELTSGEYASAKIFEVTSIPTLITLENDFRMNDDIEDEYRKTFIATLSEIHQTYSNAVKNNVAAEISIELLWITEKIDNQPYAAKIRLLFIIRAVAEKKEKAESIVESIGRLFSTNITTQKYSLEERDVDTIQLLIKSIDADNVRAISKSEKVDSLQNQILPFCYSFDILDASTRDFSNIVNALIAHPKCAVSVQLIPTTYTVEEEETITQISQSLDMLSKGVLTPGAGNIGFSSAESLAERYKYYQINKNGALFEYNILVVGSEDVAADVSSALYGYATHDNGASAHLKNTSVNVSAISIVENFIVLPWICREYIQNDDRDASIWSQNTFGHLYRIPFVITAEEATLYFRLPIGSTKVSAGLPIDESENKRKTFSDNLINTGDITIGYLKSSPQSDSIGISLKDLARHMLVVGTPGSGKTTFSVSILDRLWNEHHIPFLVIEPAKNEYRALVQSIPDLQVFTPGKNHISPFVFNPFVPPQNVRLETYKTTLKTAFSAAVSMSTPLDKIFEETINNCYSDFRWLDTYTIGDKGQIFNISDFIKCFQNTFDEIGYTGDAKNIGRAGVVRLNSLSNLFDNYFSIPIRDLLEKPTIIELAAIENIDQKALIISLILLSILAYVNSNYVGEGGLKNVILLEEAHVLLDAESNASQGDANPSAIAQGLVKRMLAEIRSYGVGMVIADQSPRKVSTDVVALTDMKMVFRLVEATDKQIVADSMNMSETQIQRMSRLKPGEAFLFFNRLDEPEEVITPDYRLENNISITLSDDGLRELTTYWNDKQECLRPYPECAKTMYCTHSCDYGRRILAREIARRIFVKNFKTGTTSFEPVKKVFGQITNLVKAELNDESFSKELLSCVKVHLWRRIRYGTKIPVRDAQIMNSLEKY